LQQEVAYANLDDSVKILSNQTATPYGMNIGTSDSLAGAYGA
jgi:hypothetical protein